MLSICYKLRNSQRLKCMANLQRCVCSGHFKQLLNQDSLQNAKHDGPSKNGYGEKEIFLLGPVDVRTPLPGNIGIPPLTLLCTNIISQLPKPAGEKCEVITHPLPEERYENLLTLAACTTTEEIISSVSSLECVGHDCPHLLRKDFSKLFPSRDLSIGNLTVITLCQKTQSDMSQWSESAEVERMGLELGFITAASTICTQLNYYNYWADFIHPKSGKPNFNSLTDNTMFETDVRYRNFGFSIEDLGCCRIIIHKDWGTNIFVGAVFTNAPVHSKEVQNILNTFKNCDLLCTYTSEC